jgi:aspartate/methionine/tyrosine aminotransferase
VGTLSKPFGLPGLRVGWFAANAEIAANAWSVRDYVSLSPAKMSDAIAKVVIEERERILPRNAAIIEKNLGIAQAWFAENADLVNWSPPRAGLLAMVRYNLDIPSLELADRLAQDARIMLAPGSTFGIEHHLRIGIGQRPDLFEAGLQRTADYLRGLK